MGTRSDPARRKPEHEIWAHFTEQREMLESSCAGYDAGKTWEAKRIASCVHTFVHDFGRTVSLLSQLKLRGSLRFISSAIAWSETSPTAQMPLVAVRADASGCRYVPFLDDRPPERFDRISFSSWWEQPILRDVRRRVLTRKNLVFSLRDQDGGGHVDATLSDEGYASLSRQGGAAFQYQVGDNPPRNIDPGPHLASMRQIGWELLRTIADVQAREG